MPDETSDEAAGEAPQAEQVAESAEEPREFEAPERGVLSTGEGLLDTRLNGGIRSGSTVSMVADPLAMPEVFLYKFTEARRTFYFNTERKADFVREDVESYGFEPADLHFVDVYSHYYLDEYGKMKSSGGYDDRRVIDFVMDNLKRLRMDEDDEINIIFDSFSFFKGLDAPVSSIDVVLNTLYETVKELDGLSFLLADVEDERLVTKLEGVSDAVMRAEIQETEDTVDKQLYVPKLRGGTPPERYLKYNVDIDKGIKVETGRLV